MASRLAEAQILAKEHLMRIIAAAVAAAWTGLGHYDEAQVDQWLGTVLPLTAAANRQAVALTADLDILADLEQFTYEFRAGRGVDLNDMPALLWRMWIHYKAGIDQGERAERNRMSIALDRLGGLI